MKVVVGEKTVGFGVVISCLLALVALCAVLFGTVGFFGGRHVGLEAGIQSEAARIAGDQLAEETLATDAQLADLKKQVDENDALLKEIRDYQKNRNVLAADVAEKTAKVEQLNGDISAKQAELDRLTGDILKAQGAPISLPAGEYTGGTDVPAGRYSVSGSSNFVVHDVLGDLKVNTILGDSMVGVGTYTCQIAQGDQIQSGSKVTFTPIG